MYRGRRGVEGSGEHVSSRPNVHRKRGKGETSKVQHWRRVDVEAGPVEDRKRAGLVRWYLESHRDIEPILLASGNVVRVVRSVPFVRDLDPSSVRCGRYRMARPHCGILQVGHRVEPHGFR